MTESFFSDILVRKNSFNKYIFILCFFKRRSILTNLLFIPMKKYDAEKNQEDRWIKKPITENNDKTYVEVVQSNDKWLVMYE